MHFLRLASFCLGAWLIAGVVVVLLTSDNSRSVAQILREHPREIDQVLLKLEENEAGSLLRHHASVVNGGLAYWWEITQLALGVTILLTLFFGSNTKRYAGVICLLMLISVGFQHWFLAPQMARLSPTVDFLPPDQASMARDRFRSLATGYGITEGVKLLLGAALAVSLFKRRRRRSSSSVEVD